jgi:transcriptional regulator with XRE-family HTH domain
VSSHNEEPELGTLDELKAALPMGTRAGLYRAELQKAQAVGEDGVGRLSFSAYMRAKREELGLSMRQAAKRSDISEGRWRQLESGYQSVRGEKIPVRTTADTVLRIATGTEMHPDIALFVAGVNSRTGRVKISETGIWPLPKHVTFKQNPDTGEPVRIKESHVTSETMRKARKRLRTLETLCESLQTLPIKDLEYMQGFIEETLAESYAEQQRLDDEHARGIARLEQGYSDEEGSAGG